MCKLPFITLILLSLFIISCEDVENSNKQSLDQDFIDAVEIDQDKQDEDLLKFDETGIIENDPETPDDDSEEKAENEISDNTEITDNDICIDGDERDIECGINDRGVERQNCVEGKWIGTQCIDTDVCKDGTTDTETCGVLGTRTDTCVEGQWVIGECDDNYENPDGELPAQSKGKYLYFSGKKLDDKYNSDLYMIDMTASDPTVIQLTDTDSIDEVSPTSPADNRFLVYAHGYYNDPSFSRLRYVELDAYGKPIAETDTEILGYETEVCDASGNTTYYGKGNPSVSLDGTEIVFVNTYKANEDNIGCPVMAYRPARVSLDANGNVGTYENLVWDGGPTPNRMTNVPLSPVYLKDTKQIVLALFGMDQHPLGSEIQICNETCDDWGDWSFLTYQELWSSGNVAQRSISASMSTDEIIFFRRFPGTEFDTGIYTAGDIIGADPHPTYGAYGVLETTETYISGFGSEYMSAAYRALTLSPDGKLIAIALTFVDNQIEDEEHSQLVILERESGKILKTFDFTDAPLREVDGLLWR